MEKLGNTRLRSYVDEYVQYGIQSGFFDKRKGNEIKSKLLNLEVEIVDGIGRGCKC